MREERSRKLKNFNVKFFKSSFKAKVEASASKLIEEIFTSQTREIFMSRTRD